MAQAATRRQVHCFNLLRQVRILQNAGAKSVVNQMKARWQTVGFNDRVLHVVLDETSGD